MSLQTQEKILEQTVPFVVKTAILCLLGWFLYNRWSNRFVKMDEHPQYGPANITIDEARSRAEAIAGSIGWFSNSFETVASSLSGLNYNGFVRVYNAFGKHTGTLLGGDLDLVGWLRNQFNDSQMQQLSLLLNSAFFRDAQLAYHEQPPIQIELHQTQ